jgi:RNA polymerase sigma factor (sigma-70 family)
MHIAVRFGVAPVSRRLSLVWDLKYFPRSFVYKVEAMDWALKFQETLAEQDSRIDDAVRRDRARLRNFIRRRVTDDADAEEILQEVFYELVETYRLMKPIEQVSAWLFRVARNRITDLFRKKKPLAFSDVPVDVSEDGEALHLEDLLPSPDAGPDAAYARSVLIEELDAALEELPAEQREAFVAHEIEGRSFKELAAQTGLSVNALVLRKHYAVQHLRERLAAIHNEFAKS